MRQLVAESQWVQVQYSSDTISSISYSETLLPRDVSCASYKASLVCTPCVAENHGVSSLLSYCRLDVQPAKKGVNTGRSVGGEACGRTWEWESRGGGEPHGPKGVVTGGTRDERLWEMGGGVCVVKD